MNGEMFFQNYYIRIREDGAVMQAWSGAFTAPPKLDGLSGDILITDRGEGTQFRLTSGGEENPWRLMWNENGIPLLKWNAQTKTIDRRTQAEIDADKLPAHPPIPTDRERIAALEMAAFEMALQMFSGGKNYD